MVGFRSRWIWGFLCSLDDRDGLLQLPRRDQCISHGNFRVHLDRYFLRDDHGAGFDAIDVSVGETFAKSLWLGRLGVIAYGLYLIHSVVFIIVMTLLRGHTNVHWAFADVAASLFSIALSIGIAQVSWLVFEKRFVRWGRTLNYTQRLLTVEAEAG